MNFNSSLLLYSFILFTQLSLAEDTTTPENENLTFDIDHPILIRCSPFEEIIQGQIRVEEDPRKWKYEQQPTWGYQEYRTSFTISSSKKLHLTFTDNHYSCKPQHIETYKSDYTHPPTYKNSEAYLKARLGKYGQIKINAIDEQTAFSIELHTTTDFESGSIKYQHKGTQASCSFRKGALNLDDDIPSLKAKL